VRWQAHLPNPDVISSVVRIYLKRLSDGP